MSQTFTLAQPLSSDPKTGDVLEHAETGQQIMVVEVVRTNYMNTDLLWFINQEGSLCAKSMFTKWYDLQKKVGHTDIPKSEKTRQLIRRNTLVTLGKINDVHPLIEFNTQDEKIAFHQAIIDEHFRAQHPLHI